MTDWVRKLKLLKDRKRIAALGLWGLVVVYLFAFFPTTAFFELSPGPDLTELLPLESGSVYEQQLALTGEAWLRRIEIRFGAIAPDASGMVDVAFYANGTKLQDWSVPVSKISDSGYTSFSFGRTVPIRPEDAPGFTIQPRFDRESSAALWTSDGGDRFFSNGNRIAGKTAAYRLGGLDAANRKKTLPLFAVPFLILLGVAVLTFDPTRVKGYQLILVFVVLITALRLISTEVFQKIDSAPTMNWDALRERGAARVMETIDPITIWECHVDANKMGFTSLEFFITSGQSELLEVQLIGEKDHAVYYDQVMTGEDFFETPYPGRASVSLNAADAIGLEGGYFPDIQYILYITNADTERPLEIEVLQDGNGTRTPHIFLHRDSYNVYRFAVAVILFVFGAFAAAVFFNRGAAFTPERFFLFAAVPLVFSYFMILPTFCVDDAYFHYSSGYHWANLLIGDGDHAWLVRDTDAHYYGNNAEGLLLYPSGQIYMIEIKNAAKFGFGGEMRNYRYVTDSLSSYSPLSYFPQVPGYALGRLLNLNGFFTARMARLMMILTYLFACYHAIRIVPIGKSVFALTALLPRALYACSSISYDGVVLVVGFCWVANVLRLAYDSGSKKAWAETIVWTALAGAVKGGSALLLLPIVLAIPNRKAKRTLWIMASIVAVGLLSFFVFNPAILSGSHFQLGMGDDGKLTASFAFTDPIRFLNMAWNTYRATGILSFIEAAGSKLCWTEKTIPDLMILALFLIIGTQSLLERDAVRIRWILRAASGAVVGLSLILTPIMVLKETPVGAPVIRGLLGRYYFTLLPLIFVLFKRRSNDLDVASIDLGRVRAIRQLCYRSFLIVSIACFFVMFRLYITR